MACSSTKTNDTATDAPLPPRADCDPTAPNLCGTPFPSTFYMKEDASTATGWRIDLGPTTLPDNIDLVQPHPTYWNEKDGWAVSTPLLVLFPSLSLDNIPGHDRIADSLSDDSPIVIIDVDTGERKAAWAERDISLEDSDRSNLMIHPAAPFDYGHRYVVGLRNFTDTTGAPLAPSPGMDALIRNTTTGDTEIDGQIERRREVYDDLIFPTLEANGWNRDEILLAWDFVVASKESITGRAVATRDMALDWIPEGGPTYEITDVDFATNEHTAVMVRGILTVPQFTEDPSPGTFLTRDESGMPYIKDDTIAYFTVIIPNSVYNSATPAPLLQYGHGLLGGRGEVESGYLAEMADRYGWVLFAMDWTGMKSEDTGSISLMLVQDIGDFAMLPERCVQGFAEFHVGLSFARNTLLNDPQMMAPHPETGEPQAIIDPSRTYYYGNSQGAILGAAYGALAPDIDRVTLGVGGGPYHTLLTRSRDFEPFFLIFKTMYPDPAEVGLLLGMIQTLWDEAEGAGYANAITRDPLPGTREKVVLQQVGIGDNQVSTLGAEFLARGHGAVMIGEPAREVYGIDVVDAPTTGTVLVEYLYGVEEPYVNHPPTGDDPHEWVRREFTAQEQMAHFFETGEIDVYCDGVCGDPTRGAN